MSTIWFACKQCGRKHSRPESSSGTFIFCDCGEGMAVPWESTTEAPPIPEVPPLPAQRIPPVPPVLPQPVPPPPPDTYPLRDAPEEPRPRRPAGRRAMPRRRDPRFCLNHEDTPSQKTCADCREAFCTACTVEFQGATLCGPCKNFRARVLQSPPRLSAKALSSVLVALLSGPLAFCLVPVGGGAAVTMLPLIPQLLALGLGVWALYDVDHKARVGGRSMAITGVLTGAVASVATILVSFFAPIQLL